MIVVQLLGGLGNQMFQYALGRSLAIKRSTSLKLDVAWFDNIENKNTNRQYELDNYLVSAKIVDAREIEIGKEQEQKHKLPLQRFFTGNQLSVYAEPDASFHKNILELPDNTYLVGYWQNENYFKDIRSMILKEFKPKKLSNYSQKTTEQIRKQPSVSLHVRRGDYANNPLTLKFHGLTPVAYYTKALDYIYKNHANLQIFVFSDDIKWCKDNLPLTKEAIFVNGNKPERSCEDMFLMSLCDHNVIANSSFSWWGAWLNESPDKIVVAPKTWFQEKKANQKADIVPRDWVKL
jgi:hypothetical protein